MLLVYLLVWCILGFISVYVTICAHMIKAYINGYDSIGWWQDYLSKKDRDDNHRETLKIIYGLIVWPIRLIAFVDRIPELYEQYELLNEV